MTVFSPGPSQLHAAMGTYLQQAHDSGLLSASHRSAQFVALSQATVQLLREKLDIPPSYQIFFVSSATECWEIISQSLVQHSSHHQFSGSFGEKWFSYAKKIHPNTTGQKLGIDQSPDPSLVPPEAEVIGLTHSETSNGTMLHQQVAHFRQAHAQRLIAVDATSSLGGCHLPMAMADVWYGSVQKCFGMPAGLGLLVCGPQALARAAALGERRHYNSLLLLMDHMANYQTSYTPSVLHIFLLHQVLQAMAPTAVLGPAIAAQAAAYYHLLEAHPILQPLVAQPSLRSHSVVAVQCALPQLAQLKKLAAEQGLQLGNGYGPWKEGTFRIATFPAIAQGEHERLRQLLASFS